MTKSQVMAVLDDLNYSANTLINMNDITAIYITADGMLYPGDSTRFCFKTDDGCNLLEVYDGHEENGEFIQNSKYPNYFCSFDIIGGFYLTNKIHSKMPYKIGQAV